MFIEKLRRRFYYANFKLICFLSVSEIIRIKGILQVKLTNKESSLQMGSIFMNKICKITIFFYLMKLNKITDIFIKSSSKPIILIGNLGMLSVGLFLGWASPSLPFLTNGDNANYPVRLKLEEASWVVSLLTLGASGGCLTSAFMVNVVGRKNTMLFTAVPSVIGWLLIVFATSPWVI